MSLSATYNGSLILFRSHPDAPFADAVTTAYGANFNAVHPVVFVPAGHSNTYMCGYCGQECDDVPYFKGLAQISCYNHEVENGHGSESWIRGVMVSRTTVIIPIRLEKWNGFRKNLGFRSPWGNMLEYKGELYEFKFDPWTESAIRDKTSEMLALYQKEISKEDAYKMLGLMGQPTKIVDVGIV